MIDYLKISAILIVIAVLSFWFMGNVLMGAAVGAILSVLACIGLYNIRRNREWVIIPLILLPLGTVVGTVVAEDFTELNLAWRVLIGMLAGFNMSVLGVMVYFTLLRYIGYKGSV